MSAARPIRTPAHGGWRSGRLTIKVGAPLTRGGAPVVIPWTDPTALGTLMNDLERAMLTTFFPNDPAAGDRVQRRSGAMQPGDARIRGLPRVPEARCDDLGRRHDEPGSREHAVPAGRLRESVALTQ